MTIKRVFLTLLAALLLPGLALAQTQTRATFTVQKEFTDGNSATDVTVRIECFTGVPLDQSATRTPDGGDFEVEFVVENFDNGQLDCDVTEDAVAGYTASYYAESQYGSADYDDEGCYFDNVQSGGADDVQNTCQITNSPDPITVEVCKDWVIEGSGGDDVDQDYDLYLSCNNEIVGSSGTQYQQGGQVHFSSTGDSSNCGKVNSEHTAAVIPYWDGGTSCSVSENTDDSYVETDSSDCDDLHVNLGGVDVGSGEDLVVNKDSCTVTNTVFFEGIPTLSQYGMAILALLMLGVGFVGFRRFV